MNSSNNKIYQQTTLKIKQGLLDVKGIYNEAISDQIKSYGNLLRHTTGQGLAKLYRLLDKPRPYARPTHDLFCGCRKCEPSVTTYIKRMRSIQ